MLELDADVPVSPAADELGADGDVPLVEDDVDSLGVVPAPAAEDGEVVVAADDELPGAGAVAAGGGVVTVVELDEGA